MRGGTPQRRCRMRIVYRGERHTERNTKKKYGLASLMLDARAAHSYAEEMTQTAPPGDGLIRSSWAIIGRSSGQRASAGDARPRCGGSLLSLWQLAAASTLWRHQGTVPQNL